MRYKEIVQGLLEADDVAAYIKKNRYGEITFGSWEIKYDNFPNANGKYAATTWHVRERKIVAKVEADSPEAAVEQIKNKIEVMNKANEVALKYSEAQLCFNVEFTRDVLSNQGITGVRLQGHGDAAFLVVAGAEYFEEFGNEIYGRGPTNFVKLFPRLARKELDDGSGGGAAQLYAASITGNQIKTLGLKPNGRYALESEGEDDLGNLKFRLVYDSVTMGKNDKVRLHKPGLTIAVF
jgi:hypothetical protein